MTVPATARRAGPYNGNGSATVFSFSFKAFAAADLLVTKTSATGIETVLVLDSDYSVTLNVDQDASPGGSITYPISGSALATGEKLTIVGDLDYEQTTDLLGGGAFNAAVIESTFDRATIQIQQLEERLDRALSLPVSATASAVLPVPDAGKVIAWDSTASALVNVDSTDLASTVAYANWRTDRYSGTGAALAFTLSADPGSVHNMDVSIGGVVQQNGVDFTVSGTTLTFTSAPPLGTNNILARYGQALPQGTVDASAILYNPATAYDADSLPGALSRIGAVINSNTLLDASGATNAGAGIQAIIDANKGRRVVLVGPATYMISDVRLNNSTYGGTIIEAIGDVTFKLAPDGGASTFGGAWVGLLIKDCSGVQLRNVNWDGNRGAMTAREQIFCVGIAGATDYLISGGNYTELRGDGIYVSQSDWLADSALATRGRITGIRGRNSAVDGRNLISVISADDLEIDHVDSRLIGGVISATTMPAGICVEADLGYHALNDIRIHDCHVISAGTSGVCILGKSISGVDASEDWNATNCSVKDVTVRMVTGVSAGPAFSRVTGLNLDIEVVQESGTRRKTCVIDAAERVYGRVVARGGSVGLSVGEAFRVRDFGLDVQVYDYENAGLKTCDVDYGMFFGVIYGALNNINSFAIQLDSAGRTVTQTAVTYSIDARFDGNNLRAVRLEPGAGTLTFTNTRLANCDMSGYSTISNGLIDSNLFLPASNVVGLTDDAPAVAFSAGDTTPSVGLPARHFACANAAPTSITMFDDGYDNREFVLRLDSNTTIVHNASNIRLAGAANITGRTSDDFVTFRRISGIWFEQGRSW